MPRRPKNYKICSFRLLTDVHSGPPTKLSCLDKEITSGYLNLFLRDQNGKEGEEHDRRIGLDRDLNTKLLHLPPLVDLDNRITDTLPSLPKSTKRHSTNRSLRMLEKKISKGGKRRKAPQSNVPQSNVPQNNVPQSNAPQSNAPQSNVLQSNVLQSNVLQSNAPQSNAPQSNAPQSNAPQSNAPQSNAPQSNAPQSNAPQSNASQSNALLQPITFV